MKFPVRHAQSWPTKLTLPLTENSLRRPGETGVGGWQGTGEWSSVRLTAMITIQRPHVSPLQIIKSYDVLSGSGACQTQTRPKFSCQEGAGSTPWRLLCAFSSITEARQPCVDSREDQVWTQDWEANEQVGSSGACKRCETLLCLVVALLENEVHQTREAAVKACWSRLPAGLLLPAGCLCRCPRGIKAGQLGRF